LLVLPLCLLKTSRLRSNLKCKYAIKRQRQEEGIVNAIPSWGMPGGSLELLRESLAESSPTLSDVNDEDLDLGERNIKQLMLPFEDLKTNHPFQHAPSLPYIPIDHHPLIASSIVVLDRIKSFPRGTSCERDGLCAQHLTDWNCPQMLGEYITSVPLTPLVKPSGGICLIIVGTIWRRLVFKVSAIMIGHSLDGYLECLQFGVGVSGGSKAILHVVNRPIEGCGDLGLKMHASLGKLHAS
ncbi:hypothetical protein Tco_1240677, partial [Tanacetum coccineum]